MELFNRGQGDSKASGGLLATPVWGQGWADTDVVGESNYGEAIRRLLPKGLGEDGEEVFIDVLLVREPGNRYDRNAIAVRAETGTVGYLPRETAVRYSPVLDTLASSGGVAQTSARVWGCIRQEWDSNRKSFSGSVRIALPEPHMLFPANPPPEAPHAVLPVGPAIQVTGEENYRSNLKPWLNSHGEAWVHATLHPVVEATARTSKTLAEVRIDGLPVGRLTPKMSQDMLPAVDYLAERGLIACVRGVVKGNALKSDVVLYSARAGDLAAEWLDSLESGDQAGAVPKVELPAGQAGAVSDPAAAANAAAPAPPPAGLPPANWYPDPHGVARLRYWDGAQWTDHTAE